VPPIGVFIVAGCGADLLINICLTLLGFVIPHSQSCASNSITIPRFTLRRQQLMFILQIHPWPHPRLLPRIRLLRSSSTSSRGSLHCCPCPRRLQRARAEWRQWLRNDRTTSPSPVKKALHDGFLNLDGGLRT
jgi:hypothetical protein